MIETIATLLASVLLVLGSLLCLIGAVGFFRFPDFYTRVHASSVTDTLGAGMILVALMLLSDSTIGTFKLVLILLFLLITGPTAVHALVKSAVTMGVLPGIETEEIVVRSDGNSSSKPS